MMSGAPRIKLSHGRAMFHCPGCGSLHQVAVDAPFDNGARWGFNGSLDRPTFTPSVLVTYTANPDAGPGFEEWRTERRCHSFVTDGQIQFLSDCTHHLAGLTVDLPEYGDPQC